jgi:hypothetical protein
MKDSTREISPLRQWMLEDMRLRKLAPHTQASYVRAVRKLAGYLRRPPDTATVEDLRNFQMQTEWLANTTNIRSAKPMRAERSITLPAKFPLNSSTLATTQWAGEHFRSSLSGAAFFHSSNLKWLSSREPAGVEIEMETCAIDILRAHEASELRQ